MWRYAIEGQSKRSRNRQHPVRHSGEVWHHSFMFPSIHMDAEGQVFSDMFRLQTRDKRSKAKIKSGWNDNYKGPRQGWSFNKKNDYTPLFLVEKDEPSWLDLPHTTLYKARKPRVNKIPLSMDYDPQTVEELHAIKWQMRRDEMELEFKAYRTKWSLSMWLK